MAHRPLPSFDDDTFLKALLKTKTDSKVLVADFTDVHWYALSTGIKKLLNIEDLKGHYTHATLVNRRDELLRAFDPEGEDPHSQLCRRVFVDPLFGEHGADNPQLQNPEDAANEDAADEGAGNEGAGNEDAANEGAGNEDAGNEGAGNEDAANEGAGNEDAGNEGAGNEDAADEGAGNEVAADEGIQNPNQEPVMDGLGNQIPDPEGQPEREIVLEEERRVNDDLEDQRGGEDQNEEDKKKEGKSDDEEGGKDKRGCCPIQ
ncbi:hypothetical protein Lser_V15G35165 [Lactuca serriola]|uniref:Uncharacterized protein n=1 Tax=Lactuca sativa TaxID=4236 RepID=A0A9R1UYM6_LACSA|nr:hypothetical protein LSAT_V11C700383160 [Lactuca sativa]